MGTDNKTTYTRMLTVQNEDWLQNQVQKNVNSSNLGLITKLRTRECQQFKMGTVYKTTYTRMLTVQNGDWQQNNIHENVKSSKWGLTTKQRTQEC